MLFQLELSLLFTISQGAFDFSASFKSFPVSLKISMTYIATKIFRTSQFIIGLNKYLESVTHGFGVGMRFKMRFEGEDTPERRYQGICITVISTVILMFFLLFWIKG